MKRAFLIICIAAISGIASAQLFQFGIKGGLNYSKLSFDKIENVASTAGTYTLKEDESFQGFHIGIQTRLNIFNFYIGPELMFNTSGGRVLIENTSSVQEVRNVRFNKIDLPIMAGLKFGPLRVNAGPVASVVLSTDSEIDEIIPDLSAHSKGATLGFQAGAGLDILKFVTLDGRYEGGLSKIGDKLTVAGHDYNFDSRASKWLISLGFLF